MSAETVKPVEIPEQKVEEKQPEAEDRAVLEQVQEIVQDISDFVIVESSDRYRQDYSLPWQPKKSILAAERRFMQTVEIGKEDIILGQRFRDDIPVQERSNVEI